MPRINLVVICLAAVISFLCYQTADKANQTGLRQLAHTYLTAMQKIEDEYVEPVDRRKLFESSLAGMVNELDQYSAYIPPSSYSQLKEGLNQSFGGIGVEVTLDADTRQLVVTSPLVGTPAFQAGIQAGDVLLEIDGESTDGFDLEDAVKRIKGPPGRKVFLTVQHEASKTVEVIPVTRAIIEVPTVRGDSYNPDNTWNYLIAGEEGIGLLRIKSFGEKTVGEVKDALKWLKAHHMKGLVIDLRDNPGGLLDAAVAMCDELIETGLIVSTQGRNNVVLKEYQATGNAPYTNFPIAVLANSQSASAAEIVAACLQDHKRAVVIGQRTWGKGSVQYLIDLEGGASALKLTTATYWRPSHRNIHRLKDAKEEDDWGVHPNEGYKVEVDEEEYRKVLIDRRNRDVLREGVPPPAEPGAEPAEPVVDRQLQKAIEYLKQQIQQPAVATKAA